MSTNAAPIFDAALALPQSLRADLAAKLLESLDDEPPAPDRTPEEWAEVIAARSDALHAGESDLIDGEEALAMIQAAIDRAASKQ